MCKFDMFIYASPVVKSVAGVRAQAGSNRLEQSKIRPEKNRQRSGKKIHTGSRGDRIKKPDSELKDKNA